MATKAQLKKGFKLLEVTVEDVYKAIKENGFEHIRQAWIETDATGKQKACVLGQGALNLGVVHTDLGESSEYYGFNPFIDELEKQDDDIESRQFVEVVEELSSKYSLETQLNRLKVSPTNKWYIENTSAGSTIVEWNDKMDIGGVWRGGKWIEPTYTLKTYDEVTEMAYDVLKPHFTKKVKLLTYDFDNQVSSLGAVSA